MSEKVAKAHSLNFANNTLTVNGVVQVQEISEKEALLKLYGCTLCVKGNGLNVVKLDREQGIVQLEAQGLQNVTYRQNGVALKGLFK